MAQKQRPVIGVIVNNVGGYSRSVIRGISSFANARAWTCRVQGLNEQDIPQRPDQFDGLIVQAATPQQVKSLSNTKTPVVNVSSALPMTQFPTVVSDDRAVGRLGADYFLRRGYRQFIFYSPDSRAFAKLRQEGFEQRLAEQSVPCQLAGNENRLATMLKSSAKPVAVMGSNDRTALAVLDACRDLGLKVPDEVAVLGVDNDDVVQSLAYPPLSTINTARERIGFDAADLLEKLMMGNAIDPNPNLIQPIGVITRQSTDVTAIKDEVVAEATRYIHARAGSPITVDDVAKELALSRRQLERRFRITLGKSILDEILRCRVDRARQLLTETQLTLSQVASASGFASASYFNVVFRKMTNVTPGEYRQRLLV